MQNKGLDGYSMTLPLDEGFDEGPIVILTR